MRVAKTRLGGSWGGDVLSAKGERRSLRSGLLTTCSSQSLSMSLLTPVSPNKRAQSCWLKIKLT